VNDDVFDHVPVPDGRMALRIAGHGAAAGALAGGIETLGVSVGSRLVTDFSERLELGVAVIGMDAALGWGCGLAGGLVAQLLLRRLARWRRYRIGMTLAVLLLAAFFLMPLARELWIVQQRRTASLGMCALLAMVGVSTWFNAGYWFRREMLGAAPRFGWRLASAAVAVALVVVGALGGGGGVGPVAAPIPGAPNIVLVTVDTLRRDHLGAYGALSNTPVFDRLAREGLLFEDAVTPVPETAPSHASMFTGLHPGAHAVVANGIPLRGGFLTLAEQLGAAGYRTGAFVSSYAVDDAAGLAQGFEVYDDDFLSRARGAAGARVARLALPLLMRFRDPTDFPFLLERDAPATLARADAWVASLPPDAPFFLWVHLFEPHSPYEPRGGDTTDVDHRAILAQEPGYAYAPDEEAELRRLYRTEVEYTDGQLGALLDGLKARGALEDAVLAVIADHGESLGEHGIMFNHHGLYEEVVRVPFVLWSTRTQWTPGQRVARQVTVMDVANTLLGAAGMPLLGNTESETLATLALGADVPARPLLLVGRMNASLSEGQLRGVRDPTGVKYIHGAATEELYDLATDPAELRNIADEQPAAVESGRRNVELLGKALSDDAPAEVDAMLEALGYKE
jgi:arylsulfatase A-like enzyme